MELSSLRWLSHWRHAQGRYLWRQRPTSPPPARQSKRSRIKKNIIIILFAILQLSFPLNLQQRTFSWPYQEFSKEIKVAWKCTRDTREREDVWQISLKLTMNTKFERHSENLAQLAGQSATMLRYWFCSRGCNYIFFVHCFFTLRSFIE